LAGQFGPATRLLGTVITRLALLQAIAQMMTRHSKIGARSVEAAVVDAITVSVYPDDLSFGVDAYGFYEVAAWWIDGRVDATVVEEAERATPHNTQAKALRIEIPRSSTRNRYFHCTLLAVIDR